MLSIQINQTARVNALINDLVHDWKSDLDRAAEYNYSNEYKARIEAMLFAAYLIQDYLLNTSMDCNEFIRLYND